MSTALHDFASAALVATALAPGEQTESPTGSTLDMLAADGQCFAIQQVGAFSADSLIGSIEESSTGSTWTAVDDAAFTEVAAGNNLQVIRFTRTKRYVRYVAVIEGDTPSVTMAVLIGEQKKSL
jgi:hypothetical protein